METESSSATHAGEPCSLYRLFAAAVQRNPTKTAILSRAEAPHFRATTYRELQSAVLRLAAAMARTGIQQGDRVAILASNGPLWATADLALLFLGAIVVPIYHTLPPPAVKHILNDSACRLAFVQNQDYYATIDAIRDEVPSLERIVAFDADGIPERTGTMSYEDLLRAVPDDPRPEEAPLTGGELATIVYTSGTTGEPKGVALSHRNIAANARAAVRHFRVDERDVFLSFLPACHMFERTCGHFTMLAAGATIAYARALTTIVEDIAAIRPTILIVVPRIVEKVYEAMAHEVSRGPAYRQRLIRYAIGTLNEWTNRRYRGQRVSGWLALRRAVLDRLVASKFRKVAGGRLRLLMSGGAALERTLGKTLLVLGFNILEGYGLTEAAPVLCAGPPSGHRLGTVGPPLDGVEIQIGAGEEILARGPNVMVGYYGRPEETRQVIDSDGWLHTGDRGRIDEQGNLVITGRLKEMIVTSYGKNIVPGPIEGQIAQSDFIAEAMLYGDGRKYLTVLLLPEREILQQFAQERGIEEQTYADLLRRQEIVDLIQGEVDRINAALAEYEKVRRFALLTGEFSVENGLLTPTMKLRRARIADHFRAEIAAMYA